MVHGYQMCQLEGFQNTCTTAVLTMLHFAVRPHVSRMTQCPNSVNTITTTTQKPEHKNSVPAIYSCIYTQLMQNKSKKGMDIVLVCQWSPSHDHFKNTTH